MGINLRRRLNLSPRPVSNKVLPLTTIRRGTPSSRNNGCGGVRTVTGVVSVVVLTVLLLLFLSMTARGSHTHENQPRWGRPVAGALVPFPNTTDNTGVYHVIVVGCGPAGLAAALFAARASLRVLVFGSTAGGLLASATDFDNFPSFATAARSTTTTSAAETWLRQTQQQAEAAGATFATPAWQVTALERSSSNSYWTVTIDDDPHSMWTAPAVIVATGATPHRLGLEHETELWGRALHSCAICDAAAYGPQDTVLVVGGGDAAVAAALYLARRVARVVVVYRQAALTRPSHQQAVVQLQRTANIDIKYQSAVHAWRTTRRQGDTGRLGLEGATLVHAVTGHTENISCAGAFLMIGATPNTAWLTTSGIVLDAQTGLIDLPVHGSKQTSLPGVFAAGEVAESTYRQAITAAAEGAQAAMDAERWLAALPKDMALLVPANPSITAEEQQTVHEPPKEEMPNTDETLPCQDLVQKDCLLAIVHKFPVVVFSKPWCPYCRKAREILQAQGAHMFVVDLTTLPNGMQIQNTLQSLTGRRTVPNVFVGGESIGGGDETVGLHRQGKLTALLREAGAIA